MNPLFKEAVAHLNNSKTCFTEAYDELSLELSVAKGNSLKVGKANTTFGYEKKVVSAGADLLDFAVKCAKMINASQQPVLPAPILRSFIKTRGTVAFSQDTLHMLADFLSGTQGVVFRNLTSRTISTYVKNMFEDVKCTMHGHSRFIVYVDEKLECYSPTLGERRTVNSNGFAKQRTINTQFPREVLPISFLSETE